MIISATLPAEGFITAEYLIGRPEVTVEEAEKNKALAAEAIREGRSFTKPRRPRCGILGIFPGGRTSLYKAISEGEFPPPVKRGRHSFWPVAEVRKALEAMATRYPNKG